MILKLEVEIMNRSCVVNIETQDLGQNITNRYFITCAHGGMTFGFSMPNKPKKADLQALLSREFSQWLDFPKDYKKVEA